MVILNFSEAELFNSDLGNLKIKVRFTQFINFITCKTTGIDGLGRKDK